MLRVNHELSMAITKALVILGYMEMSSDEQPKDAIWNHPEMLDEWFEQVKQKRENPNHERVDNKEWESADLEQNELTKDLR